MLLHCNNEVTASGKRHTCIVCEWEKTHMYWSLLPAQYLMFLWLCIINKLAWPLAEIEWLTDEISKQLIYHLTSKTKLNNYHWNRFLFQLQSCRFDPGIDGTRSDTEINQLLLWKLLMGAISWVRYQVTRILCMHLRLVTVKGSI